MNFGRNRPVAGHRFGKAVTGVRSAVAAPITHSWRNGRRSRLRSGRLDGMEVQVLPGAPINARFAKRPRHRSYTPTFPGSSPGASTNDGFVSLAAKAPARHAGDPRFESATRHHHFSRSSKAERPADNRKTADRYRAGEPTTGDQHDHDHQKTGTAGRRIFIADGPGAFKPETVGQRAFNPCAKGFNSSRVPQSHDHHTRLAQLVRAPSS